METVTIKNIGKSTFTGLVDVTNKKVNLSHNGEIQVDIKRAIQLTSAYPRSLKMIKPEIKNNTPIIPDHWYLNKIPKICSFYWGNKILPYIRLMSMVSFHKLNPDWEVRLYVPMERYEGSITWNTGEQDYNVEVEDCFDELKNYPGIKKMPFDFSGTFKIPNIPENFKSDFLRWHLLSTIGGLWCDNDIIFVKSMNCFNKNRPEYQEKQLWLCFHGYHSCGFLMSSPKNIFFAKMLDFAKMGFDVTQYQSAGPDLFRKYNLNNHNVLSKYGYENIDLAVVYPYDSNNIYKIFNESHPIPDISIGLHWYAGSQLAKKCVNILNKNNCKDQGNTLSNFFSEYYRKIKENHFVIISTMKNGEKYVKKCVESVINQSYGNWKMIIINDASIDNTAGELKTIASDKRITVINRTESKPKLDNFLSSLSGLDMEDIIVMLDGDDWLADNSVLEYLNEVYKENVWITYGQFESSDKTIKGYCHHVNTKEIRKQNRFVTSHLKTFKGWLLCKINHADYNSNKGTSYISDDVALMTPMLEMAGNKHSRFIDKVLYIYNNENPLVGMNSLGKQMEAEREEIFSKPPYKEIDIPKISILITTFNRTHLLRYSLLALSKQKNDYEIEVIILDDGNDQDAIQEMIKLYPALNIKYIRTSVTKSNSSDWRVPGYALNIGAKEATGDYLIIMCAEIYVYEDAIKNLIEPLTTNGKVLTIPEYAKDDSYDKLNPYLEKGILTNEEIEKHCSNLNTLIPFLMGVKKKEYIDIGGYDEDFIGIACDDNDFVERLLANGNHYQKVNAFAVHLFHERIFNTQNANSEVKKRIEYNRNLFNERKGRIVRNEGRSWGVLNKTIMEYPKVTLTFTTCKRYDLFQKTIKSLFATCLDFDLVKEIIIVDDGSSIEEIGKMKSDLESYGYPYIIVLKSSLDKGHGESINFLFDLIKTDYWFQCEDDWLFTVKENYIRKAFDVMLNDNEIKEVVFRWGDNGAINQKLSVVNGIEYYKYEYGKYSKDKEGRPAWIGWNLNPSIQNIKEIRSLGYINNEGHMEHNFSMRFNDKGFKVAYFPNDKCQHLGKDRSAYKLNNTKR